MFIWLSLFWWGLSFHVISSFYPNKWEIFTFGYDLWIILQTPLENHIHHWRGTVITKSVIFLHLALTFLIWIRRLELLPNYSALLPENKPNGAKKKKSEKLMNIALNLMFQIRNKSVKFFVPWFLSAGQPNQPNHEYKNSLGNQDTRRTFFLLRIYKKSSFI